jgi:hypothetical protein
MQQICVKFLCIFPWSYIINDFDDQWYAIILYDSIIKYSLFIVKIFEIYSEGCGGSVVNIVSLDKEENIFS